MGLGASCEIETNYVAHLASIKESGIGATCWGAHAAVVVYRCQCCCKIPVKIHIIIMEICKTEKAQSAEAQSMRVDSVIIC